MKEQILELVKQHEVEFIHLEYIDYVGITRGRMIPSNQLSEVFDRGVSFSIATLGFNSFDEYIPNSTHGVDDGDFYCIPDPSTFMIYPYRKNTARMLTTMVDINGEAWEGCPRGTLKKVIDETEKQLKGKLYLGFEQEAYLLKEKEGLIIPADQSFCFSTDGIGIQENFIQDFIVALHAAGIEVVQVSSEYGPGQLEVNLKYTDAMKACDDQVTFMQLFKQLARAKGYIGTLIPKPFENQPGSGLHIHLSLKGDDEVNLLADNTDKIGLGLSDVAYHFIGGLLKHGEAITGFSAPSINSYKRLQPGTFAPAHICYGLGNRSALIRVTEGSSNKRLEFRGADGTCNPYLLVAALLASGMDGVNNKIDAGAPVKKDAAVLTPEEMEKLQIKHLPRSLGESIQRVSENEVIMGALGMTILKEYVNLKESEWIKYCKYVSEWETKALTKVF